MVIRLRNADQTPQKNLICQDFPFHAKCAPETRYNLERLQGQVAWRYHSCIGIQPSAVMPNSSHAQSCATPRLALHQLRVLRWNCESMAAKFRELAEVLERYRNDVAFILETKLGQEDPTPRINGFEAVRRDHGGSGKESYRCGGLIVYIRQGSTF